VAFLARSISCKGIKVTTHEMVTMEIIKKIVYDEQQSKNQLLIKATDEIIPLQNRRSNVPINGSEGDYERYY
jgi:hypothetical protein